MGQGNGKLSDSEENLRRKEDDTTVEHSIDQNSCRSDLNNVTLKNNEANLPQRGRYPPKIKPGPSYPKSFQKFQSDNKIKVTNWQELNERKRCSEKDYNERIIRDKEKLLKEKEETIRQQAKLIETQNLLLQQRKLINKSTHQNVNSSSANNNEVSHQYTMRPFIETTDLPKLFEAHMNVRDDLQIYYTQKSPHINIGQDNHHSGNEKADMANSNFPNIQDTSNQAPQNSNPRLSHSAILCFPLHHDADVILSPKVSRRPISYSSQISNFKAPPKHLSKSVATAPHTKLSSIQNNRTETRNLQKVDFFESEIDKNNDARDSNECIGDVLKDLETETNFVLNNLNCDQNVAACKFTNKVTRTILSNKNPKQPKFLHGSFRCPICSVTWKSKISHVGASQKCRNCNTDVFSRLITKHLRDERENSNQTLLIPKVERIFEIDD